MDDRDFCDRCNKKRVLWHDDDSGLALCESCLNSPQAEFDQAMTRLDKSIAKLDKLSNREVALLDMGLNPDEFAESKIDPALFELAEWPNAFKDFDYPCCPCVMCGHACRWVVGWRHLPSGELIYTGEDCANYLDSENVVEKQMKQFKTAQKNKAEKDARLAAMNEWQEENTDIVEFLADKQDDSFSFIKDMFYDFRRYGKLTEKQTAATRKIMAKREEFAAAKAAEVKPETPVKSGHQEVAGIITKIDWRDGYMPGERVKKLVIKMVDGNKVWGTCPKAILSAREGAKVSFLANVKRSKDDQHFGFYKFPKQAVIESV